MSRRGTTVVRSAGGGHAGRLTSGFLAVGRRSCPTASGRPEMVCGNGLHRAEVLEAHQNAKLFKAGAAEPACCSGFDRDGTAGPRGGPSPRSWDVYADCPAEASLN
jgi:hypothetical protein